MSDIDEEVFKKGFCIFIQKAELLREKFSSADMLPKWLQ